MPPTTFRPLHADDIPRLTEIRPTFQSDTILQLQQLGAGLSMDWRLSEVRRKFDRAAGYDFDEAAQELVRERHSRPDDLSQIVALSGERLVGLMEAEMAYWNNTVTLANLMIDLNYRRQGIGRQLWQKAGSFALRNSARAIMVETQNTNLPACRFYEKMGCQLVGFNEVFYKNNRLEIALFWAYLMGGQ